METGLYVSLSSQIALDRRMTTLADNVANSNTVGFRATEIKFNDVVADNGKAKVAFVDQGNEFLSTRHGGMTETNGMLDFAIRGDAWFAIETPAGQTLTRDFPSDIAAAKDDQPPTVKISVCIRAHACST